MNDLLKYQGQLADIQEKMEAIHNAADADQDGILTDEQQAEWDTLKAKREKVRQAEARAKELHEAKLREPAARKLGVIGGAGITDVKTRAEDDPRRGFHSHNEFIGCVLAAAGLRNREDVADERLRMLAVGNGGDKSSSEIAFMLPRAWTPRGLQATVGSDEQGGYDYGRGGAAVPVTFLPGMLQLGFEGDPTVGRTRGVPMETPIVSLLARVDKDHSSSVSGGFTVTRRPETVDITASRTEMERVKLEASGLFGLAYATEELLTDSPMSFIAIIDAGFRDQFAHHLLNEKLRGMGGDQYLGILTALAGSSLGPTIAITRDTSSDVKANDVVAMRARCWGYGNAIWIANHDCYPSVSKLAHVITDGGATPVGAGAITLYQTSLREDRPDMLLGRPIFYSEYASTLGSAGDLVLGNWSEFLEGLYQPLQSAESVHVRFVQHERTFKFWVRNAGAPWWRSALTPFQSTSTLSPFVVIAA